MFEMMRKVFGPIAVTVIIGAIALVFVFYGVFNPRSTSGRGGDALAATVNGDGIPMQEFAREYQQRLDFYQNMMKGKVDMSLLRQLGLKQQVLEELVRKKLMLQEAGRMGMQASDDEVRDKIQELPYFKKDGKFDAQLYRQLLEANRQSPSTFEEMIRQDLLRSHLVEFMRGRARVSEKEIESEFLTSEDRRQVDYVVADRESARKRLVVSDKEIEEFLKTEANVNAAKQYYEQNKMLYVKAQVKPAKADPKKKDAEQAKPEFYSFEDVRTKVVTEMLKDRRTEEVAKINREIGNELLAKAKSSPGQLAAIAKSKGLELKTSEKFNRLQAGIPVLGEAADLRDDAFKEQSPLAAGPKLYESRGNMILALNLKAFKPEISNLPKERDKLVAQAIQRKEQMMFEQWMGELRTKAKVTMNKAIEKDEVAEE